MRTLRLTLVGTAILALLGGLSVAVVAQTEEEAPVEAAGPAYSTSTVVITDGDNGDISKVGDVIEQRGNWAAFSVTGSDPRVSGDLVFGWSGSGYSRLWPSAETEVFSGIARLDNADGAWEGPVRGITHPSGYTVVGWLAGKGDYEGLTLFVRDTGGGSAGSAENLVYEGDPPPMPEPIEPSAE